MNFKHIFLIVVLTGSAIAAVSIKATPAKPARSGDPVTISWDVTEAEYLDKVTVYCPEGKEMGYFYTRAYSNHSVTFNLLNMRHPFVFELTTERGETAKSNPVTFQLEDEPTQIHLAYTDNINETRVMWVSSDSKAQHYVTYWKEGEEHKQMKTIATSDTYTVKEMCGYRASKPRYYRDPGYIHSALLSVEPDTKYTYIVGSDASKSLPRNFRSPIGANVSEEVRIAIYGDLGIRPPWDIDGTLYPKSFETLAHIREVLFDKNGEIDGKWMLFHIGDISYAKGVAVIWEVFFKEIESIASRIPYMVSIGNHEYDWPGQPFKPKWGYWIDSSYGECGTPYFHRFHMPGPSFVNHDTSRLLSDGVNVGNKPFTLPKFERNLWWSIDHGPVHFTMMSTEHNFTKGSEQWNWLMEDMSKVDRSKTPWLIFTGHRPMYDSGGIPRLMQHMRLFFEPSFKKYKVDIAFWAHQHHYERFCRITSDAHCSNDDTVGTIHVVTGASGAGHGHEGELPKSDASVFQSNDHGYTEIYATKSEFTMKYHSDYTKTVIDQLTVRK